MPNRINRKHTFEAKCQSCGKKAITAYKSIESFELKAECPKCKRLGTMEIDKVK